MDEVSVHLIGGPLDGQSRQCPIQANGAPAGQLGFAVNTDGGDTQVVLSYWRRVATESDGSWVAEFYPGTKAPSDWIERITDPGRAR